MATHIFHIISNKVWGGGERFALDLCKVSVDNGYKVTAIVRRKSIDVAEKFKTDGIETKALGLGGIFDVISAIKLSKMLDRAAADCDNIVVHIHNFKDATHVLRAKALATSKDKIKVICSRHLVSQAKTDRHHTSLYNALDGIIFVSQLAYDTFLSSSPDIDRSKLHVVHNSIIAPEPAEPEVHDNLTLIFMGRIVPEKGVETLIRALALTEDKSVRLNICGTGNPNYIVQLKQIASDIDVAERINWLGHIDNVWQEIRRADIGIMPSICAESFGLALLEYMSQGLAVITSTSGAQAEIVTDGIDCIMVPAADEAKLAKAIDRLTDANIRKTFGNAARETYLSRFSYTRFFKAVTDIYNGK